MADQLSIVKSEPLTITASQLDEAPAPSLASVMGPRPPGGYTTTEEPEGWFSRLLRGMLHPTPEQQLAIDVAPFATGAIGSSPNANMGPRTVAAEEALRESVKGPTEFLIKKKLGFDPDAVDLATTRMRLQAARSKVRQAQMANDLATPEAPAPTASAPAGTSPVPQGPATPPGAAPAAAAPPPVVATELSPVLKVAGQLKQAGYSDQEIVQAVQWLKSGVSQKDVEARIQATRALQSKAPFQHLPDDFSRAQAVTERNATGRWPE